MDFIAIKEYMKDDLVRVNALIRSSLSCDIDLLNRTNGFVLSHGGKQLRPLLGLLVAKACSGGFLTEDTIRFAAASELLHNATLLHDDVVDDSPRRRGEPTVMSFVGSRASVLLGDYWLVKAMENILRGDNSVSEVTSIFSKTLSDLAEGELFQLQKASLGDTTETDYYRIIYNKTASLFDAAAVSAALSVTAPDEKKKAVKAYAGYLGTAFQIKDDLFDYEEDAKTGKPAGQDLKEHKITLPLLGALAAADAEKASEIRRKVTGIDEHPEYQAEIVAFVRSNGGISYAEKRLSEYVDKAKVTLRPLGSNQYVSMLEDLADFVAERKS